LRFLFAQQKAVSEDPLRKKVKLEHNAVAEAPSHSTVSGNHIDTHVCKNMLA